MAGPIRLHDPCLACGAVSLHYSVWSYSGTRSDGTPFGGGGSSIKCAKCGSRFGRGPGGAIVTPEAEAEYGRALGAKMEAVFARRRAQQNNPPTTDPPAD